MNKQQDKQLKVFSYGLPLICLFFAWRQYVKHGWNEWVFVFAVAAGTIVWMALFSRPRLKVLFTYWMRGVHGIGLVITTVVLTAVFFMVIIPVALCLRLAGRDFLQLRRDVAPAQSYWIAREGKPGDYTKQF